MSIKFLVPDFNKSTKNKVNDRIDVVSPTSLVHNDNEGKCCPAFSSNGFPASVDGTHVVAMKVVVKKNANFLVGFTDTKTFDSKSFGFVGGEGISGTSLHFSSGYRYPGMVRYLPKQITAKAKEVVSVLTISESGKTKKIQWVVDSNDGPVQDCSNHFGKGNELLCGVSLSRIGQKVAFIPFDQVKSRSPKIDELMKVFSQHNVGQQKESGQRRQRQEENEQGSEEATQKKTNKKK